MTAVLVTGTDTGVGKTRLAAALARAARVAGRSVGVMKPCETGIDVGADRACRADWRAGQPTAGAFVAGSDAAVLAAAAHCRDAPGDVRPYAFPLPAAPSVAARAARDRIDPELIAERFGRLAATHELVLVEGAGGLLVPLVGGYTFADLARRLGLAVLVVARTGLGTVNHTALTVRAARAAGLPVCGIVLNAVDGTPSPADRANLAALADVVAFDVLAELPHGAEPEAAQLARVLGALDAVAAAPASSADTEAR